MDNNIVYTYDDEQILLDIAIYITNKNQTLSNWDLDSDTLFNVTYDTYIQKDSKTLLSNLFNLLLKKRNDDHHLSTGQIIDIDIILIKALVHVMLVQGRTMLSNDCSITNNIKEELMKRAMNIIFGENDNKYNNIQLLLVKENLYDSIDEIFNHCYLPMRREHYFDFAGYSRRSLNKYYTYGTSFSSVASLKDIIETFSDQINGQQSGSNDDNDNDKNHDQDIFTSFIKRIIFNRLWNMKEINVQDSAEQMSSSMRITHSSQRVLVMYIYESLSHQIKDWKDYGDEEDGYNIDKRLIDHDLKVVTTLLHTFDFFERDSLNKLLIELIPETLMKSPSWKIQYLALYTFQYRLLNSLSLDNTQPLLKLLFKMCPEIHFKQVKWLLFNLLSSNLCEYEHTLLSVEGAVGFILNSFPHIKETNMRTMAAYNYFLGKFSSIPWDKNEPDNLDDTWIHFFEPLLESNHIGCFENGLFILYNGISVRKKQEFNYLSRCIQLLFSAITDRGKEYRYKCFVSNVMDLLLCMIEKHEWNRSIKKGFIHQFYKHYMDTTLKSQQHCTTTTPLLIAPLTFWKYILQCMGKDFILYIPSTMEYILSKLELCIKMEPSNDEDHGYNNYDENEVTLYMKLIKQLTMTFPREIEPYVRIITNLNGEENVQVTKYLSKIYLITQLATPILVKIN